MGEAILVEVIRLSGKAGLPVWITLGLVVLSAVLMVLGRNLKGVKWPTLPPYVEPTPPPAAEPWSTDADHPGGPGGGG